MIRIDDDAPYRCVGSVIFKLQRLRAKFQIPQMEVVARNSGELFVSSNDADGDRCLSRQEWADAARSGSEPPSDKAAAPCRNERLVEETFAKADADRNGCITAEEAVPSGR